MKKLIINLLCTLLIAAASTTVLAAKSDSTTSKQVVIKLITAMSANNASEIREAFSQDATQEYERWWAREKQGDSFREWLESDIIATHGQVIQPMFSANGNEVIVTGTFTNNAGYSAAADFQFKVNDGKIISWKIRY